MILSSVLKHFRIWRAFFRMSWMENLEYRLNFVSRFVVEIIWYCTQLVVFEVLYSHTQSIAGWEIEHVRVFMGSLFLSDCIWMMLFNENFDVFHQMVKRGDLDLLLTKPVDSQFMATVRKSSPVYLSNFILVSGYLIWAISNLESLPSFFQFSKYFFLLACGLAITYSCRMFFVALTLRLHDAHSLTYMWFQFYRLGMRPREIYPHWLRLTVTFILPVGLIASVPATELLFDSQSMLFVSPFLSVLFLALARWAWLSGLRSYSSASS